LQAIVLAGGLGTRLRPITYTRPKPLVPILNKPLIDHVIELLPREVDEVFLATGYMGDTVRAHFGSRLAGPRVEVVIEERPLGTGGALKNVEKRIDGTFIVLNGDILCSLDIGKMLAFHRSSKGIGTIALWDVEDPTAFGMVIMEGKSRIREFKEKPRKEEAVSNSVNAGTYILEPEIFSYMEPGKEISIERQVFPRVLGKGLFGFGFKGFWYDAGTLANVLAIHRGLMKGVKKGDGVRIAKGAELKAPVLLGNDVSIGERSSLGPAVCIGSGVSLGEGCRLEDCAVHDNVHIGKNAVLEHCIIGKDAELEDRVHVKDRIIGDKEKVVNP
jgi:mannose-1-phosphate guanylyltransferase